MGGRARAGVASEVILLWVLVVLIAVAPAMVIGRPAWPRRRVGLLALIGALPLAAIVGFDLSTGIGGERGFPEDYIAWGILFGLLSTSVGAGFGYEGRECHPAAGPRVESADERALGPVRPGCDRRAACRARAARAHRRDRVRDVVALGSRMVGFDRRERENLQ